MHASGQLQYNTDTKYFLSKRLRQRLGSAAVCYVIQSDQLTDIGTDITQWHLLIIGSFMSNYVSFETRNSL